MPSQDGDAVGGASQAVGAADPVHHIGALSLVGVVDHHEQGVGPQGRQERQGCECLVVVEMTIRAVGLRRHRGHRVDHHEAGILCIGQPVGDGDFEITAQGQLGPGDTEVLRRHERILASPVSGETGWQLHHLDEPVPERTHAALIREVEDAPLVHMVLAPCRLPRRNRESQILEHQALPDLRVTGH